MLPRPARARSPRPFNGSPFVANLVCTRSEEHTSELQSRPHLVCRLLLEKKKNNRRYPALQAFRHVGAGQASLFFFFNDTATTEIYTLSLHDALPIWQTWFA